MKTETPLHHYPAVQGQEAGAQFIQAGCWGDFISSLLTASDTIDARRAARQQAQRPPTHTFSTHTEIMPGGRDRA